jgi:hypothetical protein
LAGLVLLTRRCRSLLILTGLSFVTIVGFNLFYGIGDIYVFYIPAYLIWVLWMGLGLALLSETAESLTEVATTRKFLGLVPAVLALALPAWMLLTRYSQTDQSQNNLVRATWERILSEPIPPNAILVSNDRDEMVPLWYLQYVEGIRTDLAGLFPLIQATPEWTDVGQVIDTARHGDRPVLLIKQMPGLEIKFRTEPAGSLVRVLGPAVEKPPEKSRAVDFGEALRLTGYDLWPPLVDQGEQLSVTLHWQPLRQLGSDYTTFVHLVNADGAVVGQSDHVPGGIYYPTHLWKPGELIKDTHTINLLGNLGRPPYALEIGLYTGSANLQHLGRPERIGFVAKTRPSDSIPADLAHRLAFVFDGQIAFSGYQMNVQDSQLALRLFWQARQSPAEDYTAFVHILDNNGDIVAQQDQQPAGGRMPTSTWPSGYMLADDMVVILPHDLPHGKYRLVAGLYDPVTLKRLPIFDENGEPLGDTAPLGDFVWPPAQ